MKDKELISAYVDGELPAGERAAFERRLAVEPQLAEQVAKLQLQNARVVEAVPLPEIDDALLARLGLDAEAAAPPHVHSDNILPFGTKPQAANDDGPKRGWGNARGWMGGGALAASLMLGQMWARPQDPAVTLTTNQAFQNGLTTARSGAAIAIGGDQSLQPILSLPQQGGGYCREFAIAGANTARGVACQEDGRWTVLALADAPMPENSGQETIAASGASVREIDAMIAARGGGDPLSADAESLAIARAWTQNSRAAE